MRHVATILLLVVFSCPAIAQEARTVSVEGRSSAQVEPDIATVQMGVLVRGAKLDDVKEQTNRRVAAIIKELRAIGLAETSIRASQIDVSLESPNDTSQGQPPQYEMYRQISVELTNLELLGQTINKAIDAGANQISGIKYGTSKEKALKQKLLSEAIENAKTEAERLSKGFGAKLGKVRQIQGDKGGATENLVLVVSTSTNPFGDETYRPGSIKIERSVQVVFELID